MRTIKKNRQKMYYSLITEQVPIYEVDDDGNLVIDRVKSDGTIVYRQTGEFETGYSKPVLFYAPISSKLNEMHAKEYGVDQSSIYSELSCPSGSLPLEYGARIWRKSPIKYKDNGYVDEGSADYIVKGEMTEDLLFDFFLLMRNNKN